MKTISDELVKVAVAFSPPEAEIMKSLLETASIPVLLKNETLSRFYGLIEAFRAIEIWVPVEKAEEAKSLLESRAQEDR